ncbi:hypothetical protein Tco_1429129 [Tanacetum coccineum]
MDAIEKRYGGNKESKKVQRTLLKQQFENFSGSSSEIMDQTFDRLQKLISQLEIQGEVIEQEDMNLKLLRRSTNTSQNSKNVAFVSSNSTNSNSSINEADNTTYGVSVAYTQSNPTSGDNLKQIDPTDLEEMDLQWEMAMLTIRARRFIKRTGRKLDVNGQRVGFDRSKVECYNCHNNRIFEKENSRRTVTVETPTKNALVAQDGIRGKEREREERGRERGKGRRCRTWNVEIIPSKPDLMFIDEIVESENMDVITVVTPSNVKKVESNHESANVKNNSDAVEPTTVRKNSFRPPVIDD